MAAELPSLLVTLTFQLKQLEVNVSPVITDKTFLHVIDVGFLLINSIEQNIAFKVAKRLHQNQ